MYYLKCTFDPDFTDLMMYLKGKYPKKLFDLDGIGDKHTDFCQFSKDFFTTKTTTSDVSVDDNANVDDLSVIAYHTEFPKPLFKLNSYYVLWKKLKQLYGLAKANQIVERQLTGDIYINDFHGIGGGFAYCFNYSTFDIMLNGLPMIKKIKSIAPKYLYSFKSQLEQFVVIASNSTLGATGLADLFIVMSHYAERILETKKDAGFTFASEEDCWKYIEENLVSFIYTINQPMRGNQSPFTNVSIYDDYFLDSLLPGYSYDGKIPNKEIVKKIQELFVDIMNKEMKRTPVTFPVTTACFSIDEDGSIQDEEFLKFISEKNLEFGFINLYCGKSSTLSSCCRLRSDTENRFFVEETFFEIETSEGIRKVSSKETLQVKNLQTNKIETKYIDEIKNCFENYELVI